MNISNKKYNFKTLNYLGSKFRLLDFIEKNIVDVTPKGAGVCDLFAGSGCVSYRISHLYPVISCDIQKYSKVICDTLLNESIVLYEEINYLRSFFSEKYAIILNDSFSEVIKLESNAIKTKNIELLADIIEHGSVEVAHIYNKNTPISEYLCKVEKDLTYNELYNEKSIISRYYGGVYFSYQQAVDIDILLEAIHNIQSYKKRNVLLSALLSTASEIVSTIGKHFAQPIKTKDSKGNLKRNTVYNKAVKDKTIEVLPLYIKWLERYLELPKSNSNHIAMQNDYLECLLNLPDNVKTIYADPPYTRDHYSRFYHVLETIALRDNPEISTVKIHGEVYISNGIYRKDRHQSPFCIKSQAPLAFREIFKISSNSNKNIVLSYSPYDMTKKTHPRVVTLQEIIDIAKEYFTNVTIKSAGHFIHNKLNSTKNLLEASDEAEVLIICTNENTNQ